MLVSLCFFLAGYWVEGRSEGTKFQICMCEKGDLIEFGWFSLPSKKELPPLPKSLSSFFAKNFGVLPLHVRSSVCLESIREEKTERREAVLLRRNEGERVNDFLFFILSFRANRREKGRADKSESQEDTFLSGNSRHSSSELKERRQSDKVSFYFYGSA